MLNRKSVITTLFDRTAYAEYEVPDEGIRFYSENIEKTFFLNYMTLSILDFGNGMQINEIITFIQENFDTKGISEKELYDDILEICHILLENNFIEIYAEGDEE